MMFHTSYICPTPDVPKQRATTAERRNSDKESKNTVTDLHVSVPEQGLEFVSRLRI